MSVKTLFVLILLLSSTGWSSTYPWDQSNCSVLPPGGTVIGAVCSFNDASAGVQKIGVYYRGYLTDATKFRPVVYANLSLNGGGFYRRALTPVTNNPMLAGIYYGEFIVTTNFGQSFPASAGFKIYFQAEEIQPIHNPPFSYDSLFGNNYSGVLRPVSF